MESSIWLWDYGSYLCCEFVFAVSFVVLLYVWSAAFFLHILSFFREGTSGTDMIAEAYRQTFLNHYSFCIPRQQDGTIPIQVFFAFVVFNGASTGIDPPYSSSTFSTTCDTLMVFQGTMLSIQDTLGIVKSELFSSLQDSQLILEKAESWQTARP